MDFRIAFSCNRGYQARSEQHYLLLAICSIVKRSMKDLEIYEVEGLSDQQRKELLKRERA